VSTESCFLDGKEEAKLNRDVLLTDVCLLCKLAWPADGTAG